jgi:flagellar L-ring protein precursor FlgH
MQIGAIGLLCVLFSSCSTKLATQTRDDFFGPQGPMQSPGYVRPQEPEPVQPASIWRSNSRMGEMFINIKAKQVGDIVTIQIVESAKAFNRASTDTERDSSVSAKVDAFLGLENDYVSTDGFLNPLGEIKGGLKNEFGGQGVTARSGDLTAFITARVVERVPGGNLRIAGFKKVLVNNEEQTIILSGVVRPKDITQNNIVKSNRIADAQIAYIGAGVVNDKQHPGWLARALDYAWPF